MTYQETIDYLYNAAPAFEKVGAVAYKEGLSNTLLLDNHCGNPHRKYLTVHVAGTNGKGSTSHTLAALLQLCGLKVGLYTSPHLVTFRERIRINGEMISEKFVVDWVEHNRSFFEPLSPSFFELTTAMAFQYFADQNVDIAVIEVGLGGRLDCTNIITPILSVITNISFDHTQFLGNTLATIAGEKAGIIKAGIPVVIGETTSETRDVFSRQADKMGAEAIFADKFDYVVSSATAADGGRDYVTRGFGKLHGQLGGKCQERNLNTVLHCLMPLARALSKRRDSLPASFKMSPAMPLLRQALSQVSTLTGLNGRWQTLSTSPLTICDTGHNLAGWQYLAPQLTGVACQRRHIVFGMVDDKDIDAVMTLLPHQDTTYYFTQATTLRAIPAATVAAKASQNGLSGNVYDSVPAAYEAAKANAGADDFIFVGGSSYVVADLLSYLQESQEG